MIIPFLLGAVRKLKKGIALHDLRMIYLSTFVDWTIALPQCCIFWSTIAKRSEYQQTQRAFPRAEAFSNLIVSTHDLQHLAINYKYRFS